MTKFVVSTNLNLFYSVFTHLHDLRLGKLYEKFLAFGGSSDDIGGSILFNNVFFDDSQRLLFLKLILARGSIAALRLSNLLSVHLFFIGMIAFLFVFVSFLFFKFLVSFFVTFFWMFACLFQLLFFLLLGLFAFELDLSVVGKFI